MRWTMLAMCACSSTMPSPPVAPTMPECAEQIEIARFMGLDSYEDRDPRVHAAERALDEAALPHEGAMGGVIRYDDGTCEDLFNPRGTLCGWYGVFVQKEDAERARAVLSRRGVQTLAPEEAATASPTRGSLEACTRTQ